ncbi:hypothetical protein ATANTOWER_017957 [Ataeniobius toweri]|uniref:ATP synthase F0 subunit 8 n=1 Tax=Ataeniobius toweri TaxID=208326 RepID=A0ABU7BQB7_9TELE|nr:hypothetical protein [Ataeniobius toweri]
MGVVWVLGIYTVTLWLKGSCLPVFQIVEQYEEQQKMQNVVSKNDIALKTTTFLQSRNSVLKKHVQLETSEMEMYVSSVEL